jgi:hypothetical protein
VEDPLRESAAQLLAEGACGACGAAPACVASTAGGPSEPGSTEGRASTSNGAPQRQQ